MIAFRKTLLLSVMLTALLTGGCSTLLSQHEMFHQASLFVEPGAICAHYDKDNLLPVYYGGVSADFYFLFRAPFRDDGEISGLTRYLYPIFLAYSVVDFPFSLTADTIIFPYNYYVINHCSVRIDGSLTWEERKKKNKIMKDQ